MRTPFLIACLSASCAAPAGDSSALASLSPDAATFSVTHAITVPVPDTGKTVRIWFPLPRDDSAQTITDVKVEAPAGHKKATDQYGNRYVYAEVADAGGKRIAITTSFTVTRREVNFAPDPAATRPLTDAERQQYGNWLGSEQNPVLVAHKLYDWTLDNVEYWVKAPARLKASPVGSSSYCLKNRTGNCTDFHSLYTALARASGLPARMQYGSLFKPTLDGVDKDASYHCWPETWFPEIGWVPNDVAVADIYVAPIAIDADNKDRVELTTASGYRGPDPRWVDYYFANLDCRRVTWNMGRDLRLDPPTAAGPVNANPKGYVEIDGAEFTGFERKMTYREVK